MKLLLLCEGNRDLMMVSVTLFQPDIPQNTGTIMRLCACFDIDLHLIEPLGFLLSERKLKRAGMDYIDHLKMTRHPSWENFTQKTKSRKILLTTKTDQSIWDFQFQPDDTLVFGRESSGVPDEVSDSVDEKLTIPMNAGLRSLNLAMSVSMALGEAMRQINSLPKDKGDK